MERNDAAAWRERARETLNSQWSGWSLTVYPEAGEAGGRFVSAAPRQRTGLGPPDPARSRVEAARRARGQVRRYCAANRLNRLGTLTYRGEGCHDPLALRRDVAGFFRRLRAAEGGRPFPYLWVAEWHPGGHGLHVHFAVGGFIARSRINAAWGNGFVHIKRLGDLPVGSTSLHEARKAAGYLGKYVGKSFTDEHRVEGLHRYEVAQSFRPSAVRLTGRTASAVVGQACERFGALPAYVWRSESVEDWRGPPSVWASWD